MKKYWGISDDPFLKCGCEKKLIAMTMLVAVSFLFTTLAVVRMRDAQRQTAELVRVVEGN